MSAWIEVTINTSGEKEWKNMAVFETVRIGDDGVTELWVDGRRAKIRETPAQVMALLKEAK